MGHRNDFRRPARRLMVWVLAAAAAGCAEGRNSLPDVINDLNFDDALPDDLVPPEGDDDAPAADGDDDGGLEPGDDLDAAPEEGETIEDPPLDDSSLDPELPVDDVPDILPDPDLDPEPDLPWGDPVCGVPATVSDCTLLCITPTTWSSPVTLPALGPGKVVELQIDIQARYFLGSTLPFDDLEVSLTSPSGTKRTFWKRFYGGNSWDSSYGFTGSWQIPAWWDQNFSGNWNLEVKDYMWSGAATPIRSWCITPPDPALFSTVDTGAHLRSCATASHGITDYCYGDAPDPCTTHPITAEHQVTELVRASGVPTLTVDITHPSVAELRIELKAPNGREMTVWNRTSDTLPTSFPLSDISGEWMTGRWALTVTDFSEGNVGNLTGWCVEAN